jgi:hypothetical protein
MPLSFRLFLVSGALLFSLTSGQAQTASANNPPPPQKIIARDFRPWLHPQWPNDRYRQL